MKKILLFTISATLGLTSFGQFFQGFENWTTYTANSLDDYETPVNDRGVEGASATYRVTDPITGSYSIKLETVISPTNGDTIFGYFLSGDPDNSIPGQGISLTGSVDSLIGWYKYDINAGDSVTIICETFLASASTGGGAVYVTGQQLAWKRFAYPLFATAGADSMILAAATGDPLNGFNGIAGTWIQFDDLYVKGASGTGPALNYSFENWTPIGWADPTGWATSNLWAFGESVMPVRKGVKYSGLLAMELTTIVNSNNDTIAGLATNGDFDENGLFGGEPYTSNPIGVEFYYKNAVVGNDTSWVSLEFKNNGSSVGNYGAQISPASTYTLFNQPISLTMAPDTVLVGAFSGENPGSKLLIDQISFIFPVGVSEKLVVTQLVSYPNPATDEIKIKFDIKNNSNVSIRLIDVTGKELTNRSLGQLSAGTYRESFNTSSFASGVYFIEFSLDGEKMVERFMIK